MEDVLGGGEIWGPGKNLFQRVNPFLESFWGSSEEKKRQCIVCVCGLRELLFNSQGPAWNTEMEPCSSGNTAGARRRPPKSLGRQRDNVIESQGGQERERQGEREREMESNPNETVSESERLRGKKIERYLERERKERKRERD